MKCVYVVTGVDGAMLYGRNGATKFGLSQAATFETKDEALDALEAFNSTWSPDDARFTDIEEVRL